MIAVTVSLLALVAQAPAARQVEPTGPASATATPETAAAPETTAPETTAAPETAPPPSAGVSDDAWRALVGKQVAVQTSAGEVTGELASADGATVVIIQPDGRVQSIPKANATDVRVTNPPAAEPPAPEPAAFPTEPPPEEGAAREETDDTPEDPADERAQRRKERRDKREHALLGAYTAHGVSYAHWRDSSFSAGHAAYAMDLAVGVNPTPRFGLYLLGGGLFGAKIDDKTVKANMGRLAFTFAFGGKWYFSSFGAGVAFSRLNFEASGLGVDKTVGLSIPSKIFARFPLPKKLYLGIGLAFDMAYLDSFNQQLFGIGGQIVFGRW